MRIFKTHRMTVLELKMLLAIQALERENDRLMKIISNHREAMTEYVKGK